MFWAQTAKAKHTYTQHVKDTPTDLDLLQVVVGGEVLRGRVGHARRHGGGLGQDPGAVDGLWEMGGAGGGRGGWHVEFLVCAADAHQRLLGAAILALTVHRLAAHDQLTFRRYPRGDGDRVRAGQP